MTQHARSTRPTGLLQRIVDVRDDERRTLWQSTLFVFFILASWYVIRPLREEIGSHDRENLAALWTGTFFAMLLAAPIFAFVVSSFSRSVFWGFMADLFRSEQSKRLFGFIAAGGTLGGVFGSLIASFLADRVGPINLILIVILLLECAAQCAHAMLRRAPREVAKSSTNSDDREPLFKRLIEGVTVVARSPYLIGICVFMFLFTLASSFAYFLQAEIVGEAFDDRGKRAAFFGKINLAVNIVTLIVQVFLTGRIVRWLGVGRTLASLPIAVLIGFCGLGVALLMYGGDLSSQAATLNVGGLLIVLATFQVMRRACNFALSRPAREVLYTVVTPMEKYKSKSFIDTVVYRGGDVVNGWLFTAMQAAGLSAAALAFSVAPVAIVWAGVAIVLGQSHSKREHKKSPPA